MGAARYAKDIADRYKNGQPRCIEKYFGTIDEDAGKTGGQDLDGLGHSTVLKEAD